jgi:hypothetical protein
MILAGLLTVGLSLFALVMVWRCWNLPPVPAIRWWSVGFGGASLAMIAEMWRAELWKNRCHELERKLQLISVGSRPRLRFSTNSKLSYQSQVIPDTAVRFVLPATAVRLLTAMIQFEPDIDVHISALADRYQKIQVGLQNIVRTQPISRSAFGDSWPSLLLLSKIGVYQPCSNVTELLLSNREPILALSWPSEMLIKRLWMRSRERPNPNQSKAKSFWNPKTLSASYATPRNGSSPSLKPFGKQPVEKTGEIAFAFLSPLSVLLREGDGICGLALWLPASAFSFSASTFHLKKYVSFLLTSFESIRIFSDSQSDIMANKRLSKEKQALVLAALCEGTPIRAVARMFKVGKNTIHRVISARGWATARIWKRTN